VGTGGEPVVPPRGRFAFKVEYFGNTEASAKKCADGWLCMGDIVRQDENGWPFFAIPQGRPASGTYGDFVIVHAFVEKVIASVRGSTTFTCTASLPHAGARGRKRTWSPPWCRNTGTALDPQSIFPACRARARAQLRAQLFQVLDQIPKTASEKAAGPLFDRSLSNRQNPRTTSSPECRLKMRAAWYTKKWLRPRGAHVGELPTPVAGPGECAWRLVRLRSENPYGCQVAPRQAAGPGPVRSVATQRWRRRERRRRGRSRSSGGVGSGTQWKRSKW